MAFLFATAGAGWESDGAKAAQPVNARIDAGSDTFPLDVVGAWTADRRTLTLAVINPTESAQQLELAITGVALAGTGRLWRMAPADLNATIVVGQKPGVALEEQALDALPGAASVAPFSVTVYAFPVK
jgi:alpha-N-arabinofuranosidase